MERLDWPHLRAYWEGHVEGDGALTEDDPDALGNVCWPGQPLFLNAHLGRFQEPVYDELLARVGEGSGQALDVGCGSGRWSRRLAAAGFEVTGIDLQEKLIAADRIRYPALRFECVALQDFVWSEPFDLISSVTVIQHNPAGQHDALAARLRSMLRDGGYLLVLENVHDQASHVFSHTVEGWTQLFQRHGFERDSYRRYDYSPFLRLLLNARRLHPKTAAHQRRASDRGPEGASLDRSTTRLKEAGLRLAVALDKQAERALSAKRVDRGSVHCGMLFRAV